MATVIAMLSLFVGCGTNEKKTGKDEIATSVAAMHKDQTPSASAATPKGSWVPVTRQTLRQFASAVGSFRARQTAQLGPQVSSKVQAVLVEVGDAIREGQALVRLDPTFFEIEVAQRRADLDAAKVALADADLNYTRMKNLYEKPGGETPSVSQKLFDDAKSRYESAVARLKQSEQALRYAEERLQETVIRAPFNGTVTRRMVDPGEPATATPVTHLLEVQEIGTLYLEFSLPQDMLSQVRVGAPIEFEVEGVEGGRATGEVSVIFPTVDEATRSFRCRFVLENHTLKYQPGLLAQVRVVEQGVENALAIPRKALSQTAAGWQALVFNDSHAVPRVVEVGLVTEDMAEIREGLSEGEKILVPAER